MSVEAIMGTSPVYPKWDEAKGPLQIDCIIGEDGTHYWVIWKVGPDGVRYKGTWEPKELAEAHNIKQWKNYQAYIASLGPVPSTPAPLPVTPDKALRRELLKKRIREEEALESLHSAVVTKYEHESDIKPEPEVQFIPEVKAEDDPSLALPIKRERTGDNMDKMLPEMHSSPPRAKRPKIQPLSHSNPPQRRDSSRISRKSPASLIFVRHRGAESSSI